MAQPLQILGIENVDTAKKDFKKTGAYEYVFVDLKSTPDHDFHAYAALTYWTLQMVPEKWTYGFDHVGVLWDPEHPKRVQFSARIAGTKPRNEDWAFHAKALVIYVAKR